MRACCSFLYFGFLPVSDARVLGTLAAIEKHLVRDGFVLRLDTSHGTDGLSGSEGAFLACTFWLADNYAFAGRVSETEALFERLLALRNHLGLLSEEYDSTTAAPDQLLSAGVFAPHADPESEQYREKLWRGPGCGVVPVHCCFEFERGLNHDATGRFSRMVCRQSLW
jgi:hypothetical protein